MSEPLPILLFGPGLPSGGQPSTCQVEHDYLSLPEFKQSIRFAELTAKVGSFDHNQLQLTWQYQGQTWLLIPQDQASQKNLVNFLPMGVVAGLDKWKRSTLSQNLVWKTVIYSICSLVAAVLLVIWQYDAVVTWVAGKVPIKTEYQLGQSVLASLKEEKALIDKGPALDAVKKIGDRLTKGSPYKFDWHVSTDPAINAFALPGGIVIVNKGLIEKADNANEVAGVLAHEIQHVEQRHALKNMITSSGLAAAALLVLGDANAMIMIMAHQVSSQYFSRQAESDADMKGIELLHQKKINPQGLVTFFRKLQAEFKGKGKGEAPEWMSSHPETENRIKAVEDYNKAHPCSDCEMLKWDKKGILASLEKFNIKSK